MRNRFTFFFLLARLASATEFTTVDGPNSTYTWLRSINASGQVVGTYQSTDRRNQGLLRQPDGTLKFISVAGAHDTDLADINDSGVIAGYYSNEGQDVRGFVYQQGVLTKFNLPDSVLNQPTAINGAGTITGTLQEGGSFNHGFVRDISGNITIFDPPNSSYIVTTGINDSGQISGYFTDTTGTHGFLRDPQGSFTILDIPGAVLYTAALAINNTGEVVGSYWDFGDVSHGFTRSPAGVITTFDAPGVPRLSGTGTTPYAINDSGQIAGIFVDGFNHTNSWFRFASGTLREYQEPFAGREAYEGTFTSKMNASGTIVGSFQDRRQQFHGFIAQR